MTRHPLFPALVLAAIIAGLTPLLTGKAALLDTSIVIAIYALFALSVGLTYGLAGLLSVAQASFGALGGYTTAILSMRHDVSPFVTLPLAILLPTLFAYPFARLVTRLSPLALAIATLLFGYAFDIGVRELGDFTGGYIGLSGIPQVPGFESALAYHGLAWGLVCVVAAGYGLLRASHLGYALRTIRNDALRASADGVPVEHLRSAAMALSAGLAGLAGWLYVHHVSYLGPESLSPALSLSVLLMAVVGGLHSVLGPVVGAALLTLVHKFIPGQEVLGMFYGSVLILCLLVAPNGLMGLLPRRPPPRAPAASRPAPVEQQA